MSRISTTASKPIDKPAALKPASRRKNSQAVPDNAERCRMIAAAAYYRAEKRGFTGGDPVQDWLAAEAEIGRLYH